MKITWLGHSCFKVESKGETVILDPYSDGSVPGLAPVREKADLVLCSHEHGDHNARSCVTLTEGAADAISVTKLDTWHDEARGAKRGPNTIHILEDGEVRIAHLGDLGCELTENQKEVLKGLDALLIPVGGFYTIDAAQAAKLAKELSPRTVIPMHYHSEHFGFDVIGTVEEFTERMQGEKQYLDSEVLVSNSCMPAVTILRPKNVQ